MSGDVREIVAAVSARMTAFAEADRFEDAAGWRDRLGALLHASVRTQRLAMLAANPEILAAQQTPDGGWEIHCIRYGTLAGAVSVERGVDPRPAIEALKSSAEHVAPTDTAATSGLAEEADAIGAWLEGARLVETAVPLSLPLACGGELAQRKDDHEEVIRKRHEEYLANTAPLLGYYGARGLVAAVDGVGSLDVVTQRIRAVVKS